MQVIKLADSQVAHVAKLTLYCTPQGKLIVPTGNQRISVSHEEARELLDEFLEKAEKFTPEEEKRDFSQNGHKLLN